MSEQPATHLFYPFNINTTLNLSLPPNVVVLEGTNVRMVCVVCGTHREVPKDWRRYLDAASVLRCLTCNPMSTAGRADTPPGPKALLDNLLSLAKVSLEAGEWARAAAYAQTATGVSVYLALPLLEKLVAPAATSKDRAAEESEAMKLLASLGDWPDPLPGDQGGQAE